MWKDTKLSRYPLPTSIEDNNLMLGLCAPMCQTIPRAQAEEEPPGTPAVVVHEPASTLLATPEKVLSSPEQRTQSGTSTPKRNGPREITRGDEKSSVARKDRRSSNQARKLNMCRNVVSSPPIYYHGKLE